MDFNSNSTDVSDGGNLNDINLDELLSVDYSSNKRSSEVDINQDSSKRSKTAEFDDPLSAVFADLPSLDPSIEASLSSSLAPSPLPATATASVPASVPATVAAVGAGGDAKGASVKGQFSGNPSTVSTPTSAAPGAEPIKQTRTYNKKTPKGPTKKEQKAAAAAAAALAAGQPLPNADGTGKNAQGPPKEKVDDPDRMNDAVLAAGIDLRAEESLLAIANQNKILTSTKASGLSPQKIMDLRQFGGFMNKVIKENALAQLPPPKTDVVELVQLACDDFMRDIITNSVVFSRHRRRPVKSKVRSSSTARSDVSKALRDLAVKDKEAEEKRMKKRVALGMDTGEDKNEKAGLEETLHRAANATAAMMMAGPKKKKYSWMTGGNSNAGAAGDGTESPNAAMAARGDTGIRFREAREEPGIVLRDIVAALETKRIGVDRSLTKAYSKL